MNGPQVTKKFQNMRARQNEGWMAWIERQHLKKILACMLLKTNKKYRSNLCTKILDRQQSFLNRDAQKRTFIIERVDNNDLPM